MIQQRKEHFGDHHVICSDDTYLTGTFHMINKKKEESKKGRVWIVFAVFSSFFASAFSFFIKIGLVDIPSDLGTLLKTVIAFDTSLIDRFFKNRCTISLFSSFKVTEEKKLLYSSFLKKLSLLLKHLIIFRFGIRE